MPTSCCVAGAASASLAQPELIDRTLAIVGGQAITLSDARAAIALGLVDGRGRRADCRRRPARWSIAS